MANPLQELLDELLDWKEGEDLQPLVAWCVTFLGPTIVVDLPKEPRLAREKLISLLEQELQG